MTRSDPVTSELHAAVLTRDRECVQAKLDPRHACLDIWGNPHASTNLERLSLDHVQEGYGRMGKRAPSTMGTLVSLCGRSHLGGWATSHRPELRAYLASVASAPEHVHVDPVPGCAQCFEVFG